MTWLLNVYYFSLGVGGLYLLIAGALGAIGAAGHGAEGIDSPAGGHGLDAGHDFGSGDMHAAELPSGDLDGAGGLHAELDASIDGTAEGGAAHTHLGTIADHQPDGAQSGLDVSPFNLVNLMCLLASFGGSGLALLASGVAALLTFPLALAAGLLVTAFFHWMVTQLLTKLQAPAVPTQMDMLGLEAEVLTPIDTEHFGEIAYTLDGQRFTSPARLLRGERAGRKDPVTIVKVEGNTVYVEQRQKLLD